MRTLEKQGLLLCHVRVLQIQNDEPIADREGRERLVMNVLVVSKVQALQSQLEEGTPSKC